MAVYGKKVYQYVVVSLLLFATACGGTPQIIPTPVPSLAPTATALPTPLPTATRDLQPTATLVATATIPPTATQRLPSVGEILAANGRFSTFNTTFELTNLDEALNDPGPFTLFVPTNDAFAKLEPGVLDALRVDPKGRLSDLVLHHVVKDSLSSATLGTLTAVNPAQGDAITIQLADNGQLLLNGSALIIAEIPAFNGFVYAIDVVLLPNVADLFLFPTLALADL